MFLRWNKKTLKIEEKHNFISKNLILIILIFSDSTIKSTTKDTYIGAIQYKVLGNNKKIWEFHIWRFPYISVVLPSRIFKYRVWENIVSIGVLLETPVDVWLKPPRFSLETSIFSLETPRLSMETPRFS